MLQLVSPTQGYLDWIIERIYRNDENKFKGEEGKRFTSANKIKIIINE